MPPETFTSRNFHSLCNTLAQKEAVFAGIIQQHGYPPLWSREPGFETLTHIILEQQVSLASALAAFQKLKSCLFVVSPATFLTLDDAQLKACYFSRQKTRYVRSLAIALEEGVLDLSSLTSLSDAAAVEKLTAIKGIGQWSASIYLMVALHRVDCFPAGDIALLKSISTLFSSGEPFDKQAVLAMSEQWKPLRTIASYLLWHAYLSRLTIKKGHKKSTKPG